MAEINPETSTIKKPLNQNVQLRHITSFNKTYVDLKKYCDANGFEAPDKGIFLGDVIAKGLVDFDPQAYLNQKI